MQLAHYTSLPALLSILESGSLWASNIQYLNDKDEFFHCKDEAFKIIQNRMRFLSPGMKLLLENLEGEVIALIDDLFICSFSSAKDLLSQWRGYCPPTNGACVLFSKENITTRYEHSDFAKDTRFVDCMYDIAGLEEDLNAVLINYADEVADISDMGELQGYRDMLALDLAALFATYKNPSFREECESRLIIRSIPRWGEIKYRATNTSIIPFIEINLHDMNKENSSYQSIAGVVIGPFPNNTLTLASIERLANMKLFASEFLVELSKIPYRSF